MRRLFNTLTFIIQHPLTRGKPLAALVRFVRWQVESRVRRNVHFDWVEGAKLIVRRGMTGATGNIYCGLHEYADMAFVLHLLRPGDLFVDVGANIGSYTVLASKVCGAHSLAFEPDPEAMAALQRNIAVNGIADRVNAMGVAVGAKSGTAQFTVGLDTLNHVATGGAGKTREVRMERLDEILAGRSPVLIKLDVEGFEAEALEGASATLRGPSLLAVETEGDGARVRGMLSDAGFTEAYYDPKRRRLGREPVGRRSNALFVRDFDACSARLASAARRSVVGQHI